MSNKDEDIDNALEGVPTAKNKNEDIWGHEGRSRPHRSVDLEAPIEGESHAPLPGIRATSNAGGLPVRTPSALREAPPADTKNKKLAIGGGIAGVVAIGAFFALTSGPKNTVGPGVTEELGILSVTSTPPGAEVLVGGQGTGKKTPTEITGVRKDSPVDVTVRLAGYLPDPPVLSARIPLGSSLAVVDFKLQPARSIRVKTEPPGATVEADGRLVGGTTPLNLPPVIMGKSVEIFVKQPGFQPVKTRVFATDTSSVVSFVLAPARNLDLGSEPVGSRILIDDADMGVTPQSELAVPTTKFTLKVDRPGFEPFVRKFKPGTKNEKLEITLKLLPLSKMPLAPEDKKRVAELQGELARAKLDLAASRAKKKAAENKLDSELKKNRSFVTDTSKYQDVIDREDARAEELEQRIEELNTEWEAMQEEVLGRIGADH
ncbi:MAG: PEGA domain-containing protein [Deltaproteobacteria bacterium]|nr:PEGA domain-containing protein [Deltaproteobacteria bacterium]